jgi:WD repeat and SOF domain-containing protein 1
MFAMPFVTALAGHRDGVFCMRRHPTDLKCFLSGSFDGGDAKLFAENAP